MAFSTTTVTVGELTKVSQFDRLIENDRYLQTRQQISIRCVTAAVITNGSTETILRHGVVVPANKTCKLYRVSGWGPFDSGLKWRLIYDPTGTPSNKWTGDAGANQQFSATPNATVYDNSAGGSPVTAPLEFAIHNDSGSSQTINIARCSLFAEFIHE